jgi:hypothetical protein
MLILHSTCLHGILMCLRFQILRIRAAPKCDSGHVIPTTTASDVAFSRGRNSPPKSSTPSGQSGGGGVEYKLWHEFQSHEAEFDYLKSVGSCLSVGVNFLQVHLPVCRIMPCCPIKQASIVYSIYCGLARKLSRRAFHLDSWLSTTQAEKKGFSAK